MPWFQASPKLRVRTSCAEVVMSIRIGIAGVTGDVGRLLAAEVLAQDDLTLTSAVA